MAKIAKPTNTKKPVSKTRSSRAIGRPTAVRQTESKATNSQKAKSSKVTKISATPKLRVSELRGQLEKLQSANATLRAKNREAGRAAKFAAAQIAELEAQVERLQSSASLQRPLAKKGLARAPGARQHRKIDSGDAVPLGVAVEEPGALDDKAETTLENLKNHLTDD